MPTTKPDKPQAATSWQITLGDYGTHTLQNDWTAAVAARCRRELGATPEQIIKELDTTAGTASLDTVVRLWCFAAWQNNAATPPYEQLLNEVRVSTPFVVEEDPGDGLSPEV